MCIYFLNLLFVYRHPHTYSFFRKKLKFKAETLNVSECLCVFISIENNTFFVYNILYYIIRFVVK